MTIAWSNDPYDKHQFLLDSVKHMERGDREESPSWTILAGILFFIGSALYFSGVLLNILLPSIIAVDVWIFNATGAGLFILCGLVQYFNYMGYFHILMILGGTFGLTAAILDGQHHHASVYLNFVANHLYFAEAIKFYFSHQGMDILMREITTKYIWRGTQGIADFCFIVATMVNVGLSWTDIFANSPATDDWHLSTLRTDEQKYIELASASLWFLCSTLTLAVYIRMGKVASSTGEKEDDDETENLVPTNLSTRV